MLLENTEIFHENGIALRGYDVVAYFQKGKAIKGEADLTYQWKGLSWKFSDSIYLELFKVNPEKYLPEYGGFCAYGASQGYKASTRPNAFWVEEGKLYFNFAKFVQKRWKEKKGEKIKQADEQWEETKSSKPIKAHPIPIWWKYQLLKILGKDLLS